MSESPSPLGVSVKIDWESSTGVPVEMANQFVMQVDAIGDRPDLLILSVGQATMPIILGSPEERTVQAQAITSVEVETLGRYSLTIDRLEELIKMLQVTRDGWRSGALGEVGQ